MQLGMGCSVGMAGVIKWSQVQLKEAAAATLGEGKGRRFILRASHRLPTSSLRPSPCHAGRRVEEPLAAHLEKEGLQFIQFAFRWVNCLLLREVPFPLAVRLWDTYLSEG